MKIQNMERNYGEVTGGEPLSSDLTVEQLIAGGAVTEEDDGAGGTIRHIRAVPLNNDTVTSETLMAGVTAHDNRGNIITGSYVPGDVPPAQYDPDVTHKTQVYFATHYSDGTPRNFIQRAFLSLSFGGKNIEDFGLLVTSNGFIQKNSYADFSDNVTNSDVWDGQIFWNSHFNNNTLSVTLSTDGMTQRQYDNFKRWFKPGQIKELILSEHPNRAIHARVSSPPSIQLIPFENPTDVVLGYRMNSDLGKNVPIISPTPVTTILYKGSIELEFVMDDPFWYSLGNIVNPEGPDYTGNVYKPIETTRTIGYDDIISNEIVQCLGMDNYDAWHIIHEDGVATVDMIPPDTLVSFGTKDPLSVDMSKSQYGSLVGYAVTGGSENGAEINISEIDDSVIGDGTEVTGGRTAFFINENTGISLLPAIIDDNDNYEDTIQEDNPAEGQYGCGYLFYAGTAPCRPDITFTITPEFDDDYICLPYNPIHPVNNENHKYGNRVYNTFIVQGEEKKRFTFSTPSVYTGYNQVIRIFKQFKAMSYDASWEEVRVALRNNVKHWAPRAYALWLIDKIRGTSSMTTDEQLESCIKQMKFFLDNVSNRTNRNLSNGEPSPAFNIPPAIFQINCQTGEAKGTFYYRDIYKQTSDVGVIDVQVENVGDMMCSNYLTIDERNYPDENGEIQHWSEDNPVHSHRYYTDCPMSNVYFRYRYMYL